MVSRKNAPDDGQADHLAHQGGRPRVGRIHRNSRIAQHGLGPGCSHGDMLDTLAIDLDTFDERITHVPEMALNGFMLDLVVGENGLGGRVPVDQAFATVDQAVFEQVEEVRPYRLGANLVHRETRAPPIARATHGLELTENSCFVFILPRLHARDEFLAFEIRAASSFFRENAFLDDRLRRDAGVIRSRHPQRIALLHPAEPDQNVLEGIVERVAQVQSRCDIGRRNHDGIGIAVAAGAGRIGMEVGP